MSQSINLIVTAINQSINLSSKQGAEGGHIFPKRKKNLFTYICKWRRPFRFANKTKWTSVKMSRTIGPIVPSGIQPFHCFKILLDKKKNVSYLEVFQQIVGFILQLICTKQFSVLIIAEIIYWVGRWLPSVVRTRKCRPPRAKSAIS